MAVQLRQRFSSPAALLLAAALLSLFSFSQALVSAGSASHLPHAQDEAHEIIAAGVIDRESRDNKFNGTDAEAEALVAMAISAMRVANKARIEEPTFNTNEVASEEQIAAAKEPAPSLDIGTAEFDPTLKDIIASLDDDQEDSSSSLLRRQESAHHNASAPYTVPAQLKAAAAKLAESRPQIPKGDHADVAAAIRARHAGENKDTNTPLHVKRSGDHPVDFHIEIPNDGIGRSREPDFHIEIPNRYWMIDEAPSGLAPYASRSDYQVFRNVKEYGAVGDGKTDDTYAINQAISAGNRCGATCGSSTATPAVVYFPPGTYLVSSSIIQYFNTQFLGDPYNVPTILAAHSFIGLGVITSDVYTSSNTQWYLNTANFYRSIRNFKIDLRATKTHTYICAIHWQVAQATSLENIEFYMKYNKDVPNNTQQGIYMENGSGGFLADLTFVGGNFGAYFGNQQFTTSNLVFVECHTAVQVHWDWAWTMQDIRIETCNTGLVVASNVGHSAPKSGSQGVGSLLLVDAIIANTKYGIVTTLMSDKSTSFLLQNVGFFNVETAVLDKSGSQILVPGGNEVHLYSWGFGRLVGADGQSTFTNGKAIDEMQRPAELLGKAYEKMKPNLFTRRRPKYYNELPSNIRNVRKLGAKGNGRADDTAILNSILKSAAEEGAIVFIPYGIYIVRDTLHVPVGSRIIGQAWSQIMGKGAVFEDEMNPTAVVQVGKPCDKGIIEIQDLLFTVNGATEGAVVVEWNVHEESKGSAGLWDSHIRVGGALGSNLQYYDCPLGSETAMKNCKAASLMMHLKPGSSAYIENMWAWTANHDLDLGDLGELDVYTGRGVLVESQLAYLWGTASEHAVMYQYQFSKAKNILMGMIQTESPYFQPSPKAPLPFKAGVLPNDPTFKNCALKPANCAMSWAVRIIDSTSVFVLGAGLYSWFNNHDETCAQTNTCQMRGVEIKDSYDVWVYNLCTKAITEMVSPAVGVATMAKDNVNGLLSSILGWMQGPNFGAPDKPKFCEKEKEGEVVPVNTPSFHFKSYFHGDCTGNIHMDRDINGDTCINTDCKVGSLDLSAEGLCPNGHIQISYWEKADCDGDWYGYGYTGKGQCRSLWSTGWKFKSVHLRCMAPEDDCVNRRTCAYVDEPKENKCKPRVE